MITAKFEKGTVINTPDGSGEVLKQSHPYVKVKLHAGEEKMYHAGQLEPDPAPEEQNFTSLIDFLKE